MPDIKSLRSYLIGLGFQVNTSQLAQFNNAIQSAAQVVNTNTNKIVSDIMKWQGVVIGMFDAIGLSAITTADQIATADQAYRLFGQRMFMDTQHAKSLKIALDALGQPLDAIAFDPELNARFTQLQTLQDRLQAQLGGTSFVETMVQLRDVQFEFTKFRVEALYFTQLAIKNIFQALGGVNFTERLGQLNNYIVAHIPEWSRIFTTYIVPVLRDAWLIMSDLFQVGKDFAQLFTNIIGLLSGDPTIQGQISFEKFAKSLQTVTHWAAVLTHYLLQIEGILVGGLAGGAIGSLIGGGIGLATGGPAGALAGAATGGLIGTGIGVAGGGVFDLIRQGWHGDEGSEFERIAQSVAMMESGDRQTDQYGRTITSSAGAIGRMQLMPGTARQLGVDPYNAAQNYAGGRAYLQQLYGQFGNWHDALAAYNWGPGNVQGALRQHRAFPSSVENYANSIMRGASNIQIGSININNPNASPEQIKQAIADGIKQHQNEMTSANLAELRAMY